jgi:hypothetical protein
VSGHHENEASHMTTNAVPSIRSKGE